MPPIETTFQDPTDPGRLIVLNPGTNEYSHTFSAFAQQPNPDPEE
jgi:hypothetical protein